MTHEEFRAIRASLGLSQAGLAERLGYAHASHVAQFESPPTSKAHRAVPPLLERLMRAYGDGYLPRRDPDPSLRTEA